MHLPQELLISVLQHLTLRERSAGPALVSRAWHGACHSPDLIATVHYAYTFRPDAQGLSLAASNLASFAGWLSQHAALVRELHLAVCCTQPSQMAYTDGQPLLAQLRRCEAACAAAGALRTLSVRCEANARMRVRPPPQGEPRMDCWGGFSGTSLLSLQELSVAGQLHSHVDLGALTALRRLSLHQAAPRIKPGDHGSLPDSLTALHIGFAEWLMGPSHPPVQLASSVWHLPRLRSLQVHGRAGPLRARWGLATRLEPTLERLRVADCDGLPSGLVATLASLTSLRLLELVDLRGEGDRFEGGPGGGPVGPAGRDLGAALGRLSGLTGLVMHNVIGQQLLYNLPPFAQLAGLGSLRALHYAVYAGGDAPGGLPPGACQLSVRHLAVEERLLHESRAWIEGVAALERLLVKWYVYPDCRAPGGRDFGAAKWDWLWAWAEAHAPLRTLRFDLGEGDEPAGLEAVSQRLQACRPGLSMKLRHGAFGYEILVPGEQDAALVADLLAVKEAVDGQQRLAALQLRSQHAAANPALPETVRDDLAAATHLQLIHQLRSCAVELLNPAREHVSSF
ncbi:hypothetical protein ABPG75_009126 [Micractinium tetrahymenae]